MSKDPYQAFNFIVEFDGLIVAGFSDCTGLQAETEFVDYREGGVNGFAHRFAGPTKYPPLILKRGLTDTVELWLWHQEVVQERIVRRNGTIYLLDNARNEVMKWDVKQALPVKWTGPELRAQAAGVAVESLELSHRGLNLTVMAAATSLAGGANAYGAGRHGI